MGKFLKWCFLLIILCCVSFLFVKNYHINITHKQNNQEGVNTKQNQQFQENTENYFNLGIEAHKTGNYKLAIEYYSKAILTGFSDIHDLAIAYYNRGNSYVAINDYTQAIADYTKTLEINPNYADAYANRAVITYMVLGNYNQAMEDFNKAIELDPDDAVFYNKRGELYYTLKEYEKALNDFRKSVELNPQYAKAYINIGKTSYASYLPYILDQNKIIRLLTPIIEIYNTAIKIDPYNAEAYCERGKIYHTLGISYYVNSPYSEQFYQNLKPPGNNNPCLDYQSSADCENALAYHNQSIADFDKAIQINPKYAEAYYYRAETYVKMGKTDLARSDYTRACSLNTQYCK